MNDFTKEELEHIANGISMIIGRRAVSNDCFDDVLNLLGKIKSLIDNHPSSNEDSRAIYFTRSQVDHICYQIGDWYLMMKPLLEGQHNLGYMKEKLKTMICGE